MSKKVSVFRKEHFNAAHRLFNPGWDENASNIEHFDDVREIQRQLKAKEIKLTTEADEKTTGPAGFMLTDPDGNTFCVVHVQS